MTRAGGPVLRDRCFTSTGTTSCLTAVDEEVVDEALFSSSPLSGVLSLSVVMVVVLLLLLVVFSPSECVNRTFDVPTYEEDTSLNWIR